MDLGIPRSRYVTATEDASVWHRYNVSAKAPGGSQGVVLIFDLASINLPVLCFLLMQRANTYEH